MVMAVTGTSQGGMTMCSDSLIFPSVIEFSAVEERLTLAIIGEGGRCRLCVAWVATV